MTAKEFNRIQLTSEQRGWFAGFTPLQMIQPLPQSIWKALGDTKNASGTRINPIKSSRFKHLVSFDYFGLDICFYLHPVRSAQAYQWKILSQAASPYSVQ